MLPLGIPSYLAFGEAGEYVRPARVVGELPHVLRGPALTRAAQVLGLERISFGVPIWQTLKLTPRERDSDARAWVRCSGGDLPLSLFWSGLSRDT